MSRGTHTPDAWTRARDRFIEDLSEQEKVHYFSATPETILYEVSAKQKIHEKKSKSRHLLRNVQPFIESIEQYGKALDVFVNTYPLVMSPLWGGFRIILILAHETGHYFDKIVDMLVQIGDVLPRLHVYEALFPHHERLVHSLSLIYCDLLTFCDEAKKVLRKPKRSMLSIAFKGFEHKFKQLLIQFEEHRKSAEKEVETSHMIESADSRSLVRSNQMQVAQERKESERWQIFANLTDIDYENQLAILYDLRFEGTCEWLKSESTYRQWRDVEASSGLCCRGIPGSGKSVLAAKYITDERTPGQSADVVTLFHFCDYARPLTMQPGQLYRALLKQLYVNNVMPEPLVEKIVSIFKEVHQRPPDRHLQALLLDAIEHCICKTVNVVFDGLDECEKPDQRTICDLLKSLATSSRSGVKVLATCREEERPLEYLKPFGQLRLTSETSLADIEAFVTGAVQSCVDRRDMNIKNLSLVQDVIRELVSKADGMFLWVHFQLIDLCEAASEAAIRNTLRTLPRGLDETYTRMLGKAGKSLNATSVKRALIWVACARRPLQIEELLEATAFDTSDQRWDSEKIPDAERLLQSCHGLIVRNKDSSIRFAHHTVRQFLFAPLTLQYPLTTFPFNFTICQAEVTIAELCATYLCFADFESSLKTTEDQRNLTINTIFKHGGPVAVPGILGIKRSVYDIPYKFFGGKADLKLPNVDFAKFARREPRQHAPSPDLRSKYALLQYVIDHWAWHTNQKLDSPGREHIDAGHKGFLRHYVMKPMMKPNDSNILGFPASNLYRVGSLKSFDCFWHLVRDKSLPFECRPWGPNRHFGPYGCLGCPSSSPGSVSAGKLDGISAIHWAAQTGHLPLLAEYNLLLSDHIEHEKYYQQTLILACRHGHAEIVVALLLVGAAALDDIALLEACRGGHLYVLQALIEGPQCHSHYINQGIWLFRTLGIERKNLAHCAAEYGHLHILRHIYATCRADERPGEHRDALGRTVMHYAAMNGCLEVLAELLNREECYNDRTKEQETPLMLAAKNGHAKVVEILLKTGADPKARGGSSLPIPLSLIRPEKHSEEQDDSQRQPMAVHLAAKEGHAAVLAILPIEESFSTSTRYRLDMSSALDDTWISMSALQWAVLYGHTSAVEVLLNKGYAPNENSDSPDMSVSGFTAFHFAAAMDHGEMIKILLDYETLPLERSYYGYTPLHVSALYNNPNALSSLINHIQSATYGFIHLEMPVEARVEVKSQWEGMTALHIALLKGHNKILQMLLSAGAYPIEWVPAEGHGWDLENGPLAVTRDPLGIASASSDIDFETLKQLYEATMAHPRKPDNIDADALCSAVQGRQLDKVRALLEFGAEDRTVRRTVGRTVRRKAFGPIPIAIRATIDTEQENVVEILLCHRNLYQPRKVVLAFAMKEAEDHLAETRRGSKSRTSTKAIISMLDKEIQKDDADE